MFSEVITAKVSIYLRHYAQEKGILMRSNYVNADHVHALLDLPTNLTIEELVQLLKGSSSHWINSTNLLNCKFAWGRGYAAFSVSESNFNAVASYIETQKEHHRTKTFADEFNDFAERHGLRGMNEVSR